MMIVIPIQQPSILITGASGFLGKHFLKRHEFYEGNIFCIKRPTTVIPEIGKKNKNIRWIFDSQIADIPNLDVVVHMATSYGKLDSLDQVMFNDVVWPLRILDLAEKAGCKKFINLDSFFSKDSYSYGYMQEYILAKRSLRTCLEVVAKKRNIKIYNAVLEHVYGPHDNLDKFINSVLLKIYKNTYAVDLTLGDQMRDFTYIDDVIDALTALIMSKSAPGYEEVGVGTGIKTPLKIFLEKFKNISNSSTNLNFGVVPYREGEIMDSVADIGGLEKLGWQPKINVELGLQLMHQSYGENNSAI